MLNPLRTALTLMCFLLAVPAGAAIRLVTTTGDDAWGNTCLTSPCRTVTHALVVAQSGDTISLGPGTFDEISTLEISKHIAIWGSGNDGTRVRVMGQQVVHILPSTNVILRDLAVAAANSGSSGGGIYNQGNLRLLNADVRDNRGLGGAGIHNETGATLWMTGGVLSNNQTLSFNDVGFGGGGLFNALSASAYLEDVLIYANLAAFGGGIHNLGTLSLNRVLLRENEATNSGGGLSTASGFARVWNSTFSDNRAAGPGGAIAAYGPLRLTHVTIADNTAAPGRAGGIYSAFPGGSVDLRNSIVAMNSGAQCESSAAAGAAASGSVSSDASCIPAASLANNVIGDPLLGLLANNGGQNQTRALLVGSPALDAGRAKFCLFSDQRGYQRPIDGDGDGLARCDAGAFEYGSNGPPPGVNGLWHAKIPGGPLVPKPTGGAGAPRR